eukprot:SAG11_NODE_10954_length_793_cov_1.531700_1_plen_59_part_10
MPASQCKLEDSHAVAGSESASMKPAGQCEHAVASAAAYSPAVHSSHAVDASWSVSARPA